MHDLDPLFWPALGLAYLLGAITGPLFGKVWRRLRRSGRNSWNNYYRN